jgi:trimethylamine---corrinoid protein Co-methyltransferase
MTGEPPRRRSGGRPRRTVGRLPQLPWQALRNPYAPMEMLSADQIESIHLTSLRILEELGIELMSARARDILKGGRSRGRCRDRHGAHRSRTGRAIARDRAGAIRRQTAQARRGKSRSAAIISILGWSPGRRTSMTGNAAAAAGNFADYCDFIRLAQHFNIIHVIGNQVCAPVELPANSRHLDTYRANLIYSDRVFHCSALGAGSRARRHSMMAIARGISLEQIAASPGIMTIVNANSPRRYDESMSEGLMCMASMASRW